eukprot:XP_017452256.1 PREDICTED: serine protease inhibitor Kazal-type 11-like isoform X1 [Rattus norvegicus]
MDVFTYSTVYMLKLEDYFWELVFSFNYEETRTLNSATQANVKIITLSCLLIFFLSSTPPLVAETVVAHPGNTIPQQPYCEPYRNVTDCLDTLNPICGDDGKSYDNQCYFCTETFRKNLSYKHLGICT